MNAVLFGEYTLTLLDVTPSNPPFIITSTCSTLCLVEDLVAKQHSTISVTHVVFWPMIIWYGCWVGFMYSWTGSSGPNHSYPSLPSKFFVHLELSYLSTGHPWGLHWTSHPHWPGLCHCPIQASKHYVESLTISAEKIKESASHKVKGLLCSCLLIIRLPSGSKRFNWHLETIHNCWEWRLTLAIHKHSFQCACLVLLIPRIVLILFICPHSLPAIITLLPFHSQLVFECISITPQWYLDALQ